MSTDTPKHARAAAFFSTFAPHLSHTVRWAAFLFIVDELLKLERPVTIIETGTMREPGNWAGDGNATVVWGWLATRTHGKAWSIDIDGEACERAVNSFTGCKIICGDSLRFLPSVNLELDLDLLYLDSYDWTPETGVRSALHHAAELALVWDSLPPGCLIAVDDCHSNVEGKHVLVAEFFRLLDVAPVHTSYVTIWRKP